MSVSKKENRLNDEFLSSLSAPARRALQNNGITSLQKLSTFSEAEILKFHGIGKSSIPKLKAALSNEGLTFKKKIK